GKPQATCFTDDAALKFALPTAEALNMTGEKVIASAEASGMRAVIVNPGAEVSATLSLWEQLAIEKKLIEPAALFDLAFDKLKRGEIADAEEILRRLLSLHEEESPLEPRLNARVMSTLAECLTTLGNTAEAEKFYGRARTLWE